MTIPPLIYRRCASAVMLALLIPGSLVGEPPSPAPQRLPSRQQVLDFLLQTTDWYRDLSEPRGEGDYTALLEECRTIGAQIVRFSIEFAKAEVAIETTTGTLPVASANSAVGPDSQRLSAMQAAAEAAARQVNSELAALRGKRPMIHGQERKKIEVEIEDAQTRLALQQSRSTGYKDLIQFMRSTDLSHGAAGTLELFIGHVEQTIPEAASNPPVPSPAIAPSWAPPNQIARQPSSGLVGTFADVNVLAHELRAIDQMTTLTDKLVQSAQGLRLPLIAPIEEALREPDISQGEQSLDLDTLRQRTARLEALTVQVSKVSPALSALDKQGVLLTQFQARLISARSSLLRRYRSAWETLIERLVILLAAIAFLAVISFGARRLILHHVRDSNLCRVLLFIERIVLWLAIVVSFVSAFAFELNSLVTFFGILTAGMAVALQNVLIAVIGYFILVARHRLRIGDRVELSGVTGEVIEIGLMQFQLKELDANGNQPTGRVVAFSNSFIFVQPATGLFKSIRDKQPGV